MIFTCKNFTGHYPVGAAAVIIAEDKVAARQMLVDVLLVAGLPQDIDSLNLVEIDPSTPQVRILSDGNY